MKVRNRRLLSVILAVSLVFSLNTVSFAGEVTEEAAFTEVEAAVEADRETPEEIDAVDGVSVEEADTVLDGDAEAVTGEDSNAELSSEDETADLAEDAANTNKTVINGNVTLYAGAPYTWVEKNNTVSVDEIKELILEELSIKAGDTVYYLDGKKLRKKIDDTVVSDNFAEDSISINLLGIRRAGSALKDAKALTYDSASQNYITDTKGNQLVNYSAMINTKVLPGTNSNTVTGDVFLKTYYSGSVSSQRILFADGKYAVRIDYDAAVEYRGNKVTATCHQMAGGKNPPSGTVDGALGVAMRLEKVSGNVFIPIDGTTHPEAVSWNNDRTWSSELFPYNGKYESYFWKDTTGITLKKPKVYNGKNVGAYYDESTAPYFKVPVTFKKKSMINDYLTAAEKQDLKNKLNNTKIYFTIEPRRISTDLITYNKRDADKYLVKKLTYKSGSNKLTGTIQFRTYKTQKNTINVRSLKNSGKKLKMISKATYDTTGSTKYDVAFEYNSEKGGIFLTGINGYYGSAFVNQNVTVK